MKQQKWTDFKTKL